jgi:hypothetical protein
MGIVEVLVPTHDIAGGLGVEWEPPRGHYARLASPLALPLAVERALPGVWLTPILTEASIATAVRNLSAPSLLVGGTRDRLWDAEVARQSAADVLELEGANHSLEFAESVEPSLAALRQVVAAVATFVDRLGH